MDQRRNVVSEYIARGYSRQKIARFAGLKRSTFYYKKKELHLIKPGRPIPGYSKGLNGSNIPDEQILNLLKNYRADINFQNGIGCRAFHEYLELDHKTTVNHKKIYRICRENALLLTRKKKIKKTLKNKQILKL